MLNYPNPTRYDHLTFAELVAEYNRSLQEDVAHTLCGAVGDLDCVIYTMGSDGRLEKGPVSPIEIAIAGHGLTFDSPIVQEVIDFLEEKHFPTTQEIEVVDIDGPIAVSTTYRLDGSSYELYSPNLVFDSRLLCGSSELYGALRVALFEELRSQPKKKNLDKTKSLLKSFRETTLSGKKRIRGEDVCHYSLEEGLVYYDEDSNMEGFKQGPLRAVQFALVRDKIKAIRAGKRFENIFYLPTNTLEFFARPGAMPRHLDELADCYAFFLHNYALSQQAFTNGVHALPFDREEVAKRCQIVHKMSEETIFDP